MLFAVIEIAALLFSFAMDAVGKSSMWKTGELSASEVIGVIYWLLSVISAALLFLGAMKHRPSYFNISIEWENLL